MSRGFASSGSVRVSAVRRFVVLFGALAPALLLAACSGGSVSNVPSVTPRQPGQSTAATTANGLVVDLPYDGTAARPGFSVLANGSAARPGAPVAGASVYVGPNILTGAVAPVAVPAGFARAVTDATGTFRLANAPTGRLAITIFAPAPHAAIVHQDVTLATSTSAAGTFYMTAPSAAESAWLAEENEDRAAFGAPPATLDESVVESARYWSAFMRANAYFAHCIPAAACGDDAATPEHYGPQDVDPTHRFAYEHGFSGVQEGENIAAGFPTWQGANAAFMAERLLCPEAEPANCPFTETTGHFLNIVDTRYAWTGFGIEPPAASYYTQDFGEIVTTTPSSNAASATNFFSRGIRPRRPWSTGT